MTAATALDPAAAALAPGGSDDAAARRELRAQREIDAMLANASGALFIRLCLGLGVMSGLVLRGQYEQAIFWTLGTGLLMLLGQGQRMLGRPQAVGGFSLSARGRRRILMGVLLLTQGWWSAMLAWTTVPDDQPMRMAYTVALAVMVAWTIATYSPVRWLLRVSLCMNMAAMAWVWGVGGELPWLTLVPGALVLLAYLMSMGESQHRRIVQTWDLTDDNLLLARTLRERRQQLNALEAQRRRLLVAAGHDLRQPVQALRHYLALVEPRADWRAALDGVSASAAQLEQLIEPAVLLARLDAGRLQPAPQVMPLGATLWQVAESVQAQAERRGLDLRLHLRPAWTECDPALLRLLLEHLVLETLDNVSHGGVLVAVRPGPAAHLLVVQGTSGRLVADDLLRWSTDFTVLSVRRSDAAQSPGLGFALAQRLSRLMGLALVLEPPRSGQLRLLLTLPAVAPPRVDQAAGSGGVGG